MSRSPEKHRHRRHILAALCAAAVLCGSPASGADQEASVRLSGPTKPKEGILVRYTAVLEGRVERLRANRGKPRFSDDDAAELALLERLVRLRLVQSVPPVQLSIRLLVPAESWLLKLPGFRERLGPFDAALLGYPWQHPDPGVDRLCRNHPVDDIWL